MIPPGLRYTEDHEWIRLEGDEAVLGITDHAQKQLGDITFIELPKAGRPVDARDSVAVVESVKAVSDVFCPVAGTVAAVNAGLAEEPARINRDPYGEGWICRLTGCDPAAVANLMTAEQYETYLKGL